jgi:hypothetical protein
MRGFLEFVVGIRLRPFREMTRRILCNVSPWNAASELVESCVIGLIDAVLNGVIKVHTPRRRHELSQNCFPMVKPKIQNIIR